MIAQESKSDEAETNLSVLLIDDDIELGELMKEFFETRGIRIEPVHDGRHGLARAYRWQPRSGLA